MSTVSAAVKDGLDVVRRNLTLVVAVFAVLAALAVFALMHIPRQFVAGANVLVVNGNTRDDPTLSSPDLPSIATSTVVLDRVVKALHLDLSLLTIKKHLSVKPPAYRSSIIRIEYADENPTTAALLANGVADQLTRYYGEISTSRFDADLRALDHQLARESARIHAIALELEARGGSAAAPVDDKGADPNAGRLESLQTDLELAKSTLDGDSAALAGAGAAAASSSQAARHEILQNDESYKELQAEISRSAIQLADDQVTYTNDYPEVVSLRTRIKRLDQALAQERSRALQADDAYSPTEAMNAQEQDKDNALVVGDRAKVAALGRLVASEQHRQAAETPLDALRLQWQAAQAEYLSISAHRATELSERADALSLGSAVVVDRAISSEVQVGLGRKSLAAVLMLLALTIAFGSAYLADALNPKMRRAAQIESLYGLPVVAKFGNV
jgi:capsular polysaccharide biosynthesis protein